MISLSRRKRPTILRKATWTEWAKQFQLVVNRTRRSCLNGLVTAGLTVTLLSNAAAQQDLAHKTPAGQSTSAGPVFMPPVHIPPPNPMRATRARQNQPGGRQPRSVATAQSIPATAEQSILRQVANQEPIGTGAIGTGVNESNNGTLRQTGFDPFTEVEQEFDRVAQTPAPLHTRPRDEQSNQPASPMSVIRSTPNSSSNRGMSAAPNDWGTTPNQPSVMENPMEQGEPLPALDNQTQAPRRSLIGYSMGPQDQDDQQPNGPLRRKSEKDCDEFRQQLLGQSLVDISLDISPPRRPTALSLDTQSRDWTDRQGNILATGTMVNMVRGYVVIETAEGTLVRLPFARLSGADLQVIAAVWQIPEECIVSTGLYPDRYWTCQTVTWHASNLCHKPLYFENVNLERYGHTAGPVMQPLRSTGHFFVSLLTLPYHTAINPPNECIYALGYYRPGNCAPWLVDPFPISLAGAARQATVTTGAWFILP